VSGFNRQQTGPGLLPALFIRVVLRWLPAPAFAAAFFTVPVVPAAPATAAAATAAEATVEATAAAEAAAPTATVPVAATTAAAGASAAAAAAVATATTTAAESTATTTEAAAAATGATATKATTAAARERARLGLEAITAVNGTISAGFERNLRFFSARCACGIEQLTWWPAVAKAGIPTLLLLLQSAAVWTTPRFPSETF